MTQAFEWSEEQRERLNTLQSMDARQLANGRETAADPISEDQCREWRELVKDGTRPIDITGSGFSESAIRKHAKGLCSHDPDVVGSPGEYKGGGEWGEK